MKNVLELKTKKMSLANIEGKLTLSEMENIMAGSANNRQCMIYGVLTFLSLPSGWGAMAGLWYMNSEGCFNS